MPQLQHIEDISQLSPRVRRLLGQNPSSFTLQGTNTYLVGSASPFILIDTGEGKPAWLDLLMTSLRPGETISDVILTHKHKDHVNGLPSVLRLLEKRGLPPRVWKWPEEEADVGIEKMVEGLRFASNAEGGALHTLTEGKTFEVGDTLLKVVHTPGHTSDSVSLIFEDERSIFTGDTILGEGTTVFSSLSTYLSSLRHLLSLSPSHLYPGHGPVLPSGASSIQTYISHRQSREDQIVAVLAQPPEDKRQTVPGSWDVGDPTEEGMTTEDVTSLIYKDVGVILRVAAARGVDQHLAKLEDEGRVRKLSGTDGSTRWRLLSSAAL